MTFAEVLARFPLPHRKAGDGFNVICPVHDDKSPSLTISEGADGRILLHCHARCDTEVILGRVGLTMKDLFPAPVTNGNTATKKTLVATYDYTDATGNLVYQALRYRLPNLEKTFSFRRPDGAGGWISDLKGVERVLYRLHQLMTARPRVVFISEGEQAVETLERLKLRATTNPGGAGKWRPEYTQQLVACGAQVVCILPDNDDPGRAHAEQVVASCFAAGLNDVRVVPLPDVPEDGGDITDWVKRGHSRKELLELVANAPVWTPLASAATVSTIDPLALAADGRGEAAVDLASLLSTIEAFIRTYCVISESAAICATLWVAHTHTVAATNYTPYLHCFSPEPECGKSRFVEVLQPLVLRPVKTDSITRAALIRVMESAPTLLLDELDSLLKNPELADTLSGILNAGFHRGGMHMMCVGEGSKQALKQFPVFGPKILSGIGTLPRPLLTRTIPIQLKRRTKQESITKWRDRDGRAAAAPIHAALTAWAAGAIDTLRSARPVMPDGLRDRAEDVLEPLFAIADLAGERWGARARQAAVALLGKPAVEDTSIGVLLLADIRGVFTETESHALFSKPLRETLHAREDRPWSAWGKAEKPITGQAIATLLRPFGVVSAGNIRIGSQVGAGYRRASFEEAWNRYLPPDPGFEPLHPNKANESGPESAIFKPSHASDVRDAKSPISSMNTEGCYGVRDQIPNHEDEHQPAPERTAPRSGDGSTTC